MDFKLSEEHQAFADLRGFHRVGEAGAEKVPFAHAENLRFSLQPPERKRMNDAGAIHFEGAAWVDGVLAIARIPTFDCSRPIARAKRGKRGRSGHGASFGASG